MWRRRGIEARRATHISTKTRLPGATTLAKFWGVSSTTTGALAAAGPARCLAEEGSHAGRANLAAEERHVCGEPESYVWNDGVLSRGSSGCRTRGQPQRRTLRALCVGRRSPIAEAPGAQP